MPAQTQLPGLVASILMALRASGVEASSVAPAGKPADFRRNVTISTFSFGVTPLGSLGGIDTRIRSYKSPTVKVFQLFMNSGPLSAGANPSPARSSRWHSEQCLAYAAPPLFACSSV